MGSYNIHLFGKALPLYMEPLGIARCDTSWAQDQLKLSNFSDNRCYLNAKTHKLPFVTHHLGLQYRIDP